MFLQHLYIRGGKVREDKSKIKWSNHKLFERQINMARYDIENNFLLSVKFSEDETTFVVPNNVKEIRHVQLTANIKEIVISESVEKIDLDGFKQGKNLVKIVSNNSNFVLEDHCLFNKDKTILYLAERNIDGELIIPSSVKKIADFAFAYCVSLKSVYIPDSVEHIGGFAFYECSSLTEVRLPTHNELPLNDSTFAYCYSLKIMEIPYNISSLEPCLFYCCHSLEKVKILTNKIRTISQECFAYCESLKEIIFNDGVLYVDDGAFIGCTDLIKVVLPESVEELGIEVFTDDDSLIVFTSSEAVIEYCKDNEIPYTIE